MSVIKKPLARAAYAKLPKYGRTNTTTRWFTTASGRMALDLDAMCVERFPHRRTSGRLLSWHGWMEAAILLRPMPLAEAELTGRVMGMGLNVLITEAGRRLGVSEPTASLMWLAWRPRSALCRRRVLFGTFRERKCGTFAGERSAELLIFSVS